MLRSRTRKIVAKFVARHRREPDGAWHGGCTATKLGLTLQFDLILRQGRVIDGSGALPRAADVGVAKGAVSAIGDLEGAAAATTIDVAGCYVSPGFIDAHAHTDVSNLLAADHEPVKTAGILQGVTTEVCGNCGASPFPRRLDGEDPYMGAFPEEARRQWDTLADYRSSMADVEMAANLAPLLGHGAVRASVMGVEDRPPTGEELTRMRQIVEQAMDDGAFGLSSGLIYSPGLYADTDELIQLAAVAGRHGRPYTTHLRDEGARLEVAVAEALQIGREAEAAVQMSHHKATGPSNWGKTSSTLSKVEQARHGGLDVTVDVYPYTAGSTFLQALLPPWVFQGGADEMLARLRDRVTRDRIKRDLARGIDGWDNSIGQVGWDHVVLAGERPDAGHTMSELAASAGQHPVDFVADLLQENPGTLIMIHMMKDEEVRQVADAPFAMIGSDGVPIPGHQHPRLAGTFARVLGWNAADERRLVDGIRRMTSLPAERFSLGRRGRLIEGAVADIVVFDPTEVGDRATYEEPLLPPTGIRHVLVDGHVTVRDGNLTEVRAGRVLEPE